MNVKEDRSSLTHDKGAARSYVLCVVCS